MTSSKAMNRLPWLSASIMALNFRPRPVRPTTPTMIPATAVAIETATALRAPSSSASRLLSNALQASDTSPSQVGRSAAKVHNARAAAAATTDRIA